MPNLVHFSDFHGEPQSLPPADVYVCTGDMLKNFPLVDVGPAGYLTRIIDPKREVELQTRWIREQGSWRRFLGSPEAPVIVCRGNHDFVDLAPLFGGETYEIGLNSSEVHEVCGLRFGGVRGIPYIRGEWSDEFRDEFWHDLTKGLYHANLDVLVTHAPPWGILDVHDPAFGWGPDHIGAQAIWNYLAERIYVGPPIKVHLFGHAHGKNAQITEQGGILFSNAATTWREVVL
jgi:Icc-related predicted phosphoesterase